MRKTILIFTGLLATTSFQASAINLDEARNKRYVCEKSDGLLKLLKDVEGEVGTLVRDINRMRMTKYRQVGGDLKTVQTVAGRKLQAQHGGC